MNAVTVCEQILTALVKQGYTYQISRQELTKTIMLIRGADERTIKKWIKVLETFNYIIPIATNIYQLNLQKTPQLLNEIIQQGQKRLL